MANKIYCGKGKIINGKFWEFTKLNLKLSELEIYANEKGYVNIIVSEMREPDNYGNTLTVTIDDYKPKNTIPKSEQTIAIEDVPF